MQNKPEVPYTDEVPKCFNTGKGLTIYGFVPSDALKFQINLQCSPTIIEKNNIALQVTTNIKDSTITINSMRQNIYDEIQKISSFPIKRKERFELTIGYDLTHYQIFFNGQHLCMYSQNISHTQVTHLSINGDIVIEKISYNTSLTAFKHGFKYVTELEDQFMPDMSTYTSEASLPTNASGSKINNQNFYAMPAHTEISISAIGPNYRPLSTSNYRKYGTYGICIFFIIVITLTGLLHYNSRKQLQHEKRDNHF